MLRLNSRSVSCPAALGKEEILDKVKQSGPTARGGHVMDDIDRIRAFNRFYTARLGVMDKAFMGSRV